MLSLRNEAISIYLKLLDSFCNLILLSLPVNDYILNCTYINLLLMFTILHSVLHAYECHIKLCIALKIAF